MSQWRLPQLVGRSRRATASMARFRQAEGSGKLGKGRCCACAPAVAAGPASRRMLRRKPTRLELKLDDIEEFEGARKELETHKKQREEVDMVATNDGEGALALNPDHKSWEQVIHDRIGYKPQPKPSNRSSQFGNFEF